ncbi:hypothetical protein JG687_00008469 [Phytophthora cactorum]|uniref:Uncharacterized protein n=1 Tax=Phytophthora cactorum TaxID=29920 RepID=A0A8T1UC87_9STRA|nr:hypothetical protein JG687_00008469 [Phytophthora cactorum]
MRFMNRLMLFSWHSVRGETQFSFITARPMEPGKVNLLAKDGRQTINIRDVFLTGPESTAFFRAYAFNENKPIIQKRSAGQRKAWECTSAVCGSHQR